MDIHRKSKIVAKIADNKSEVPFLNMVLEAGVDLLWLNTAHQDEPEALELVKRIRSISTRVPIMIDTKGPEIRTKDIETPFEVKTGDTIVFTGDVSQTGHNVVHVSYPNFHNEVPVGSYVLYDDASIETVVTEQLKHGLKCTVKGSGMIKNKKSLNVPDVHIKLPSLTEKDKRFIRFCAQNEIDYIAHSFVRDRGDIQAIHDILREFPNYKGKVISKIENREGFHNIDDIVAHSDGVMVARGDLGAEVPMEELPFIQKQMVKKALERGKHVIVATQALDSMIRNPRPTRAEVSDIANAILDGATGVSLSGETAYGDYPREAVEMMARTMRYAELKRDELIHFDTVPTFRNDHTKLARTILKKAARADADGILVLSANARISNALAMYRPSIPVMPVGLAPHDARELMLAYSVRPILASEVMSLPFEGKDVMIVVTTNPKGKAKISKVRFEEVSKFETEFSQLSLGHGKHIPHVHDKDRLHNGSHHHTTV